MITDHHRDGSSWIIIYLIVSHYKT